MKTRFYPIALLIAAPAFAQQHGHQHAAQEVQPSIAHQHGQSPYAGMQRRAIKALSEQQTAELRAGKGITLAMPAELNGYPGPAHVLELATPLGLSDDQKRQTRALFEQMQDEAKALGETAIAREDELDRLFREKTATADSVREATANAARAHGKLRESHLQYHLRTVEVLTPAQVAMYNRLRGYQ